tara:strand:- start:770 stop:991 length:222 start_codon:yes stop_codon:yes gene_type:complete
MSNIRRPQMPKSRSRSKAAKLRQSRRRQVHGRSVHKELFGSETPYGHKVQTDRTKQIPRDEKYPSDYSDEIRD